MDIYGIKEGFYVGRKGHGFTDTKVGDSQWPKDP